MAWINTVVLLSLTLSPFVWGTKESFSYSAISPLSIRPQTTYSIHATVHEAKEPVALTFTLSTKNENKSSVAGVREIRLEGGNSGVVNIPLKDLLEDAYNLTVKATSGSEVTEDAILLTKVSKGRDRETAGIIQTDKPIYKPGEAVKFRILLLNRFFQPLDKDSEVSVYIYDPERNVIKSWAKGANLTVPKGRGFVSSEFQLSTEPNLGTWTIEVENAIDNSRDSLQFSVDEYILPKYSVAISSTPTFATYNDSKVTVTVSAMYSYGKPVSGAECSLTLKEPHSYYLREGRVPFVTKTGVLSSPEGKISFDLDVKKELNLYSDEINKWGKTFTLFASCKDKASGHVRNETGSLTMYQFPYKIELVDRPPNIKPGFPLNLTIKVSTQDDVPISDPNPSALRILHGFSHSAEDGVIQSPIPSNGLLTLNFIAPTNPKVCYESLDVTYKELKENFWLPSKQVSSSAAYLQLQTLTPKSKIREGEPFTINVKTTKKFKRQALNAVFLSRGVLLDAEVLKVTETPKNSFLDSEISIKLPKNSAPKGKLIVYGITDDDSELIAETLALDDILGEKDNEVEIDLDQKTQEPGSNVTITLKGHKGSVVALRAVDQSVLLLKKDGNDVSEERLKDLANKFNSGSGSSFWGGSQSWEQFVNGGLGLLTNAQIDKGRQEINRPFYMPAAMPMYSKVSAEMAYDDFAGPPSTAAGFSSANREAMGSSGSSSRQPPRVRSFFPESWIWEDAESDAEGKLVLTKKVPDTITSFTINAFQLHPEHGLGLAKETAKLTVFRPFFISLNLPYSIKKGELLALQILVHNYLEKPVNASVTLENGEGSFSFLESPSSTSMTKSVSLDPSSISTLTFPITATKFGTLTLKAKGLTGESGDAVERSLLVLPPGVKHQLNDGVLVNLLKSNSFSASDLAPHFPPQRVQGADSIKVSVIGDLLGGTLNNLDDLIQLPSGCGEQNMVHFVPDLVILDYLNATGGLTDEIAYKTKSYLERGYQQQLTYLRSDGSFSAFGKSDRVGSTWLTAFVTRSFIRAQKWITIDKNVIDRSLAFLRRQQNENGSFSEEGFVYDKSLQGGTQGELALTAFTLLTFHEAEVEEMTNDNKSVLADGLKFVVKAIENPEAKKSPHVANLVGYLLHVVNHPKKDDTWKVMLDLLREVNGTLSWSENTRHGPRGGNESIGLISRKTFHYLRDRVKPATVEMTSYGLLTYLLRGEIEDSVKIVKFLLKQRNDRGGFISTQDTVMGISALGSFAKATASTGDSGSLQVELSYTPEGQASPSEYSFWVGKDNRTVVQEYILPPNVSSVDIKAQGTQGNSALAQLTWSYYVEATDDGPAFNITAEVTDKDKGRTLSMSICTTYLGSDSLEQEKKSNMAILEAHTPSGYAFDRDDLDALKASSSALYKRYELDNKDSKLNLYLEGLPLGDKICMDLVAYRVYLVAKHSPALVKIYDYYDNTREGSLLYNPPPVSLCDICKAESSENSKKCELEECQ